MYLNILNRLHKPSTRYFCRGSNFIGVPLSVNATFRREVARFDHILAEWNTCNMATRRQKTSYRVEPYRICAVGPKSLRQASMTNANSATTASKAIGASDSRQMSSGMTFNKKFGQHMLKNPGILDKIVLAAEIRASDTVMEIGPGS